MAERATPVRARLRRAATNGRSIALALALVAAMASDASAQERRPPPRVRPDTLRLPEREPAAREAPVDGERDRVRAAQERLRLDRTRPPAPPSAAPVAARAQPDSLMEALARLPGYTVTRYTGSSARFDADSGAVSLVGPATILRDGQNIAADSMLTFDRASGVVCGYGNPVLTGADAAPIASEQICYDTERKLGMALGARTQFTQNAEWLVHGERVFTRGSDVIYSADTEFTTCDLDVPHYHFRASSFKMVNERLLVARDVTLNFGDVPVFWLPFLVQSLRDGRRSGILTPSFGLADVVQTSSRNRRQIRNIGVFWAINDYMGTEAALDWRSGDWLALRGRFDYRWTRQFLQGYVNARQFFREGGSRELTLNTDNGWQPGERTQVRVSGQYASSSEFVQRETYDPSELTRTLASNGSLNHRFRNGTSLSIGASREQQLMAERITTTLPSVNLNLPTIPLASFMIGGAPTELTWGGSASYRASSDDRDELESPLATDRDSERQTASLASSFRFGNLSLSQSVNAEENVVDTKPQVVTDSAFIKPLPGETTRNLNWSSSLSYQQNLVGSLRVTPQLSLQGQVLESPRTGNEPLTSPVTLNFGSTVAADVYGFWPGIGPFERFRHKLSPSISYSFRPSPNQTTLQDSVFGANTRATNAITLSLRQTFEGKRPAEEAADSAGDPASDDRASADGEPRRLQGQTPIQILTLNTSAIAYDFEAAGRGEPGLTTAQITNTVTSDLLRDLNFSVTHSLFAPVPEGGEAGDREFDLHLQTVSANFGFTGESWLFRVLGLGGEAERETPAEAALDTADTESIVPEDGEVGLLPASAPSRRSRGMTPVGSAGTWRADFDYSLSRPRDRALDENQQINARFAFQPTENWSVRWVTSYSITDSEFQNHSLTLTRSLHRWKADFRILQAQNGNFSFEFEARLDDLPDLRIPYDQRTRGTRTN